MHRRRPADAGAGDRLRRARPQPGDDGGRPARAALRPHVKAHKCTALAAVQAAAGHTTFTCATPREVDRHGRGRARRRPAARQRDRRSRAAAGDGRARRGAVTIAVDSDETIDAAATAGIRHVLIDVNVGLPRCGCAPGRRRPTGRPRPARRARGPRRDGLRGPPDDGADRAEQRDQVDAAMTLLLAGARRRRRRRSSAPAAPARTTCHDRRHRGAGRQLRVDGHALRGRSAAVRAGVLRRRHRHLGRRPARRRRRRPQGARDGPRQPGDRRMARCWFCSDEHVTFAPDDAASRSATGCAWSRPTSTRRWRCTRSPGSCAATR